MRRLQASAAVDNTERVALQITVPDRNPTPTDPAAFSFLALDTATPASTSSVVPPAARTPATSLTGSTNAASTGRGARE